MLDFRYVLQKSPLRRTSKKSIPQKPRALNSAIWIVILIIAVLTLLLPFAHSFLLGFGLLVPFFSSELSEPPLVLSNLFWL